MNGTPIVCEAQRIIPGRNGGTLRPFVKNDPRRHVGRPSIGLSTKEWMNTLESATRSELQAIVDDPESPSARCIAAAQILAARMPIADPAAFQPYLDGTVDLKGLRALGVDTTAIKKLRKRRSEKRTKAGDVQVLESVSMELRPNGREDAAMILDYTDGKPTQRVELANVTPDPDAARQQLRELVLADPEIGQILQALLPVDAADEVLALPADQP